MQPRDRNAAYLWDMCEAARLVVEFTHGVVYAKFEHDRLLQSAVERQLEILGEAAGHISQEFRQAHDNISWRKIVGLRNILIHEYGEVRLDRIWLVATQNIPQLLELLEPLLPEQDEG